MSVRLVKGDGSTSTTIESMSTAVARELEVPLHPAWTMREAARTWGVLIRPAEHTAGATHAPRTLHGCGGMSVLFGRVDAYTYQAIAIRVCAECYLARMPLATERAQ